MSQVSEQEAVLGEVGKEEEIDGIKKELAWRLRREASHFILHPFVSTLDSTMLT